MLAMNQVSSVEKEVVVAKSNPVLEIGGKPYALQMLSHRHEEGQVLYAQRSPILNDGTWVAQYANEEDTGRVECGLPLVVLTESPDSDQHYATHTSNAGLSARVGAPVADFKGIAKRVNTDGGVSYTYVDRPVHDLRGWERTIKAEHRQTSGQSFYSLTISEADFLRLWDEDAQTLVVPATEVDRVLTIWEGAFGSSSQTRVGEMVQKPKDLSYTDYFNKVGFNVQAHMVDAGEGRMAIKSLSKMSVRVKQASSSSRPRDFMPGYSYKGEETVTLVDRVYDGRSYTDKAVDATRLFMKKEGSPDAVIGIFEDFIVRQLVDLTLPAFRTGGAINLSQTRTLVSKAATDGSHLVDREFALANGLADDKGKLASGEQIRWGATVKGLFVIVPGLKRLSGYDIMLFDGGVKGDVRVELRQGVMPFAVLNRVRDSKKAESVKLSRQVLSAIQSTRLIEGLEASTKALIELVLGFDKDAVQEFLSIPSVDEDGEEEEREVDIDQLTALLYAYGQDTFLKSHTMKRKLVDLISSALRKFTNGSGLLLENASFKHMAVDPYAIIHFMNAGRASADKRYDNRVGIQEGRTVVSVLEEAGEGWVHALNSATAVLFRFPFLHTNEARRVNEDTSLPVFHDTESARWYELLAKRGLMQGLIFYSIWDMNPEAQSGADFDGDQTLWTTNPSIVDNVSQQPFFLDYSLIEDASGDVVVDGVTYNLVEGCPFPGKEQRLADLMPADRLDALAKKGIDVTTNGIVFPSELAYDAELIDAVGFLAARAARRDLVKNDIGRFTNIGATISHLVSMLDSHLVAVKARLVELSVNGQPVDELLNVRHALELEIAGYEKLGFLMAAAIRWEIDKAKHGGAYRQFLPFLEFLSGRPKVGPVADAEQRFGISLQRLLFGSRVRKVNLKDVSVDEKLNRVLVAAGLDAIPSTKLDRNGYEVSGLKLDSHTYLQKNQLKGVHYPSPLNNSTDRVGLFTKGILDTFTWSSEYYEHIMGDVEGFLALMREHGLYTEQQVAPFTRKFNADALVRRSHGEVIPATTPYLLLRDYVEEVSNISLLIGEVTQEIVSRLREDGSNHQHHKETQNWLIQEGRKRRVLSKKEDNYLATLLAKMERTHVTYKGWADTHKVGTSPYAGAIAFAVMWREVMVDRSLKAKEADEKRLAGLVQAYMEAQGVDPREDDALMDMLRASMPKEPVRWLSSVLSLFPIGSVQFLDIVNNKRLVSYKKPEEHVTGFFGHPALTSNRRAQAKIWEGQTIMLVDGKIVGTDFQFATQDYGKSGYSSSTPRTVMTLEGYSDDMINDVCGNKYKQGGQVWTGGIQLAEVLFVQTTRQNGKAMDNGIVLWLENLRGLSQVTQVSQSTASASPAEVLADDDNLDNYTVE